MTMHSCTRRRALHRRQGVSRADYQSAQRYVHLANDTLLKAVKAGAAKQVAF